VPVGYYAGIPKTAVRSGSAGNPVQPAALQFRDGVRSAVQRHVTELKPGERRTVLIV
jgi:hypothetical protein